MAENPAPADSFPYPRGRVVGVVTAGVACDETRRRLAAAAFDADRCEVLHGEAGLSRIDTEGAARAGHYVIGVDVGGDAATKRRAAEALAAADVEFVHYYAGSYVEEL